MSDLVTAKIEFPEKTKFLFEPHRYKVLWGGRGGAKSHSIARALLVLSLRSKIRILCARELQLSITDSVHKLLKDLIDELGLLEYFRVLNTTIRSTTGSEFIFSGLKSNVSKIKSMEAVDIAWVEEAHTVSKDSWDTLIPTIRKEGSEIWASFNPHEDDDPVYQMFVANEPPPDSVVIQVGWEDNPWLPDMLVREKDYLYSVDKDAADHVWGGKTKKISNALVLLGKVVVEPFEPEEDWGGPYQGADWGFANDPATLVRCWERDVATKKEPLARELYIGREVYGVGVETVDLPEFFSAVPDVAEYVTRADSARPENISHCQNHGLPLFEGVKKTPGSVKAGVSYLRGYKRIVIHPECKHAIEEAGLWSFKKDPKTGDVLPVLIDKHDHCWDAVRYALAPIISGDHWDFAW